MVKKYIKGTEKNNIMRKLVVAFVICLLILTIGCQQQAKEETKKIKPVQAEEKILPQGTVLVGEIHPNATGTTIQINDMRDIFKKVEYQIFRTADGEQTSQSFIVENPETNFSVPFDLASFEQKRGEYQIQVFGIHDYNKKVYLNHTTMTFPQTVPILMYHAIDDYQGVGLQDLFVTPSNFEAQINYLKTNGYTLLTFEDWDKINQVNNPIMITLDDGMKNNHNILSIFQKLKDEQFTPKATIYMIADAINKEGFLSEKELRQMSDSGMISIQSHTSSHNELPQITDYTHELQASKEKIEQITGKPVNSLAYPIGRFNDQVVEETKKYYEFAVTTKNGKFQETGIRDEKLLIQRVRIHHSTTLEQFPTLIQ